MSATMRALRWHANRDLRLDEVPVPQPGPRQLLVEVERTGLCGTDVEEYVDGPLGIPVERPNPLSGRQAPLTLGHEIVGVVADCPGGGVATGTRVVPDVVLGCGQCWWCARHEPGLCPRGAVRGLQDDGGLAEYVLTEVATAVPVPPEVPADVAAFAEPVSVAVRALRKAGDLAGATVAVVGAGTIGALVGALAAARGAREVVAVEPLAERRELARHMGASVAHPPEEAADLAGAADVVLECAGTQAAVSAAFRLGRSGGVVVLVGTGEALLEVPVRELVLREQRVFGSAAHVWDTDVAGAVAALSRGTVDPRPLLAEVVPLAAAVSRGFERLLHEPPTGKILVAP